MNLYENSRCCCTYPFMVFYILFQISSQLLLGHAARDLEDFETGKAAFEWVYENDKRRQGGSKNELAQENMDTCAALLASMQFN